MFKARRIGFDSYNALSVFVLCTSSSQNRCPLLGLIHQMTKARLAAGLLRFLVRCTYSRKVIGLTGDASLRTSKWTCGCLTSPLMPETATV